MAEEGFTPDMLSEYPTLCRGRLSTLPETSFWKRILLDLLDHSDLSPSLGIPDHGVYLFSGKRGNGRHMTGNALMGELAARSGLDPEREIAIHRFRSEDFPEGCTARQAEAEIDRVFDALDAPLNLLILEDMDRYAHLGAVCNIVADWMWSVKDEGRYLLFCFAEDANRLSFDLLDMAFRIQTALPSYAQRFTYLRSQMEWNSPAADGGYGTVRNTLSVDAVSLEELSRMTDGMSYAELALTCRYLRLAGLSRLQELGDERSLACDRERAEICIQLSRASSHREQPVVRIQSAALSPESALSRHNIGAGSYRENGAIQRLLDSKNRNGVEGMELAEYALNENQQSKE